MDCPSLFHSFTLYPVASTPHAGNSERKEKEEEGHSLSHERLQILSLKKHECLG